MTPTRKLRFFFSHAALWNLAGGSLLVAISFNTAIARLFGLPDVPQDTWAVHFMALAILLFGWIYWTIGRDPEAHRAMIQFGIAGKVATVVLFAAHFLNGGITWQLPLAGMGDGVYAFFFVLALREIK